MPEVKDVPLQWIRVNFRKHADKAQDEVKSENIRDQILKNSKIFH